MTTADLRPAIEAAPYKAAKQAPIFAIDELGALYSVVNAVVCDNGSLVFVLAIRYEKETIGRERIDAALAQRAEQKGGDTKSLFQE